MPVVQSELGALRSEFPVLSRRVNGRPIVYLDSAATSLKPRSVIDAVTEAMSQFGGNVGRGVHVLADEATDRLGAARENIADFINAEPQQIAFTSNATGAANLVASSLRQDATVLTTRNEHHSNLLPWRAHARVVYVKALDDQRINLADLEGKLREHRGALVATSYVTNSFGTVQPVTEVVRLAHSANARVFIDASQAVSHLEVDVATLGCDYLCFSSHKMCGPGGVGVLYAKSDCMRELPPLHFGGGMVTKVTETDHELATAPERLEAGTPPLEAIAGLSAACDFHDYVGRETIQQHGQTLVAETMDRLRQLPKVRVWGTLDPTERGAIVAFSVDGIEAHGVARMLSNRYGICVRSGFHCAQPAHEHIGAPPTVRASFHVYNTLEEVSALADGLAEIVSSAA